jgi:hypothetical protein
MSVNSKIGLSAGPQTVTQTNDDIYLGDLLREIGIEMNVDESKYKHKNVTKQQSATEP